MHMAFEWINWGKSISTRVDNKVYLSILKEEYTPPFLEADIASIVMFDIQELLPDTAELGNVWIRIIDRFYISSEGKLYHTEGYGMECSDRNAVKKLKKYLYSKIEREYII